MPGYFGGMGGMGGQLPPWMMQMMQSQAGHTAGQAAGGAVSPLGMPGAGAAPQIGVERNANMTNTPAVQMPQMDQSKQNQDPLAGLAGLLGGGGVPGAAGVPTAGGALAGGQGLGVSGVGGGGIMGLINAFKQAQIPSTPQITPQIMGSPESMAQNGAPGPHQPYNPYPDQGHNFANFDQQADPSMFMRLLGHMGFGGK